MGATAGTTTSRMRAQIGVTAEWSFAVSSGQSGSSCAVGPRTIVYLGSYQDHPAGSDWDQKRRRDKPAWDWE